MIRQLTAALLILTLLAAVGLAAGCDGFGLINGSGQIITKSYDLKEFTRIEVSSAFEVTVTPSPTYAVSITSYENLFEYFEVSKTTDTLKIHMKHGSFTTSNPQIVITLPTLNYLSVSGASHGSVKGFDSSAALTLQISGASSLEVEATAGPGDIEVSGASHLNGSLTATDVRMKLSGASLIALNGSAGTLDIEVSGASTAAMFDFIVSNAWTDVSGASTLNLTTRGTLNVQLSGASTLNYKGTPQMGKIDVSGASSLRSQE